MVFILLIGKICVYSSKKLLYDNVNSKNRDSQEEEMKFEKLRVIFTVPQLKYGFIFIKGKYIYCFHGTN